MYTSTLIASAAVLAGTALAVTPGKAVIVNACSYPVYLSAVPSANGGYEETDITLTHGQSWSQQWTQLSNGNGWSLKMSKNTDRSNPLQYEYTYHNDQDIIWYDLSCVDGNPWNANWEVTASGNSACLPKQSFYRYATDDAFGMQDCPADSDITVTLCSGEDQAQSVVSAVIASITPSAAATSTTQAAAATTTTQPTTTHTTDAATHTGHVLGFQSAHFYEAEAKVATTPTTFATSTTALVANQNGDVVTVVETIVETAVAYETIVARHNHQHPGHPHARR